MGMDGGRKGESGGGGSRGREERREMRRCISLLRPMINFSVYKKLSLLTSISPGKIRSNIW